MSGTANLFSSRFNCSWPSDVLFECSWISLHWSYAGADLGIAASQEELV